MDTARAPSLEQSLLDATPEFPPLGGPLTLGKDGAVGGTGSAAAQAYVRVVEACLHGGGQRSREVSLGGEDMPLWVALCLGSGNFHVARWAIATSEAGEWDWRDGQGHGLLARLVLSNARASLVQANVRWPLVQLALDAAPAAALRNDLPVLVRCASRRSSTTGAPNLMQELVKRGFDARDLQMRGWLLDNPGRDGLLHLLETSVLEDPLGEPVLADGVVTQLGRGVAPLWWRGVASGPGQTGRLGEQDVLRHGRPGEAQVIARWWWLTKMLAKEELLKCMKTLPEGAATLDPEGRPALWWALSNNGRIVREIAAIERRRETAGAPLLRLRCFSGRGFWEDAFAREAAFGILANAHPGPDARRINDLLIPHPGDERSLDGNGALVQLLLDDALTDGAIPDIAGADNILRVGWRMDGLWAATGEALSTLRGRLLQTCEDVLRVQAEDFPWLRAACWAACACQVCLGEQEPVGPALAKVAGPLGLAMLARLVLPAGHREAVDESRISRGALGRTTEALLRAAALDGDEATLARFTAIAGQIKAASAGAAQEDTLWTGGEERYADALAIIQAVEPCMAACGQRLGLERSAGRRGRRLA